MQEQIPAAAMELSVSTKNDSERRPATSSRVAIIGAGYAGLAAAVELAQHHVPVTVFESGPTLGGRARGIAHRGLVLDNGQHLLVGAYRETLRLMSAVGCAERGFKRLRLRLLTHNRFDLAAAPLPAPFNLFVGLLRAHGLSLAERWRAIRFMAAMRLAGFRLERDTTVTQLLESHRQQGAPARYLWGPLCLASLNTPTDRASAQIFLNVLRDGLAQSAAASDLLLPCTDLSSLFPRHAATFVAAHGGEVRTHSVVSEIEARDGQFLLHAAHTVHRASHVICAVGPQQLSRLQAPPAALLDALQAVAGHHYEPICTVYLKYPRSIALPFAMLGLDGTLTQWLFDRESLHGTTGLIAIMISASGPHEAMSNEVLIERISSEIAAHFPHFGRPQWGKVITEKFATFACVPGLVRPAQQTPLPGFFLAGDYTAGDYPATLEAAVRSGVKCAQLIVAQIGAKQAS
jgi:squalene-associated FAD-dependent desaturase